MEFAERTVKPEDRRIIIIGSKSTYQELIDRQNEDPVKEFAKQILLGALDPFNLFNLEKDIKDIKKILPKNSGKLPDYPVYDIDQVKEYFKFPPQHPITNTAYAMCDVVPDIYIPLNNFHNYFQEQKHASFIKLCASLGAKEVFLESAEINNKAYGFNADTDIPTELGMLGLNANVGIKKDNSYNGKLSFTFSEKNKEIKEYDSPWINTEPTWENMADMRKNNYIETFKAEYRYIDDMGITANLSAKLNGMGINIGGSFNEIKKIILKYHVIFW
jgi:hypothetical protein